MGTALVHLLLLAVNETDGGYAATFAIGLGLSDAATGAASPQRVMDWTPIWGDNFQISPATS